MYTVIAYKEALQENALVRIYQDYTEKSFNSKENASEYLITYLLKEVIQELTCMKSMFILLMSLI